MRPRSPLPTHDEVQEAITALTQATGKPPSTLALAKHLGIANTTFRRQFPDITTDLSRAPSSELAPQDDQRPSPYKQLQKKNAQLRRDIEELNTHLRLAAANIQRLTLENHRLRRERDEASRVTSITRARQQGKPR